MGRKALVYTAGLIALYLGLTHATGGGTLLDKGSKGGIGFIKALQGR